MKKSTLIVIAVLGTAALAFAGSMWHLKCEAPKCKFDADIGIGGGFIFGKATGYCTTCREFVSLSWKTQGLTGEWKKHADKSDLPDTPPKKVGTVWNPATGLTADLYPCPQCQKPFMEIDDLSLMRGSQEFGKLFCPRCTNLTLRVQKRGNYD
ncbi:MAG TPA: hypothetical protein P5527_00305 [Kiritimatiellia bacterium]|jgi:hypothetical protein|nr:hypothetical protein [Kiritimatiellia bacterium]